jgi:hypothetical protein
MAPSLSASAAVMRSSSGLGARRGRLSPCRSLGRVDGLQSEGGPALGQRNGDGGERGCGAMLDGEGEVIAVAAQIEVGIAPGVELGRATQGLSGAGVAGGFPGMMDNQHGNAMAALELAQIGEQRGDLA